jgi:hypothetical protein
MSRRAAIFYAAFAVAFVAGWFLHGPLLRTLVEQVYEGRSLPVLNRLIEGQDVHPAAYYASLATYAFREVYVRCLVLFLLAIAFHGLGCTRWLEPAALERISPAVALLVLFAITVGLRWGNLGRPLSDSMEWDTAHSLVTLDCWERGGALRHKLCLLQSYALPADKFVMNGGMRAMNEAGDGYYISAPPFYLIAPYAFLKLLGQPVTVFGLQAFNMLVHGVTAWFFYLAIAAALRSLAYGRQVALVAATLFLLMPGPLWFFSNSYGWSNFWQVFWSIGCYFAVRTTQALSEGRPPGRALAGLAIATALATYSEFHGALFAASVGFYWLLTGRLRTREGWRCTLVVAAAAAFPIAVTAIQYALFTGVNLGAVRGVAQLRSNWHDHDMDYGLLLASYLQAYGSLWLLGAALLAAMVKVGPGRLREGLKGSGGGALLLFLVLPVVVHHWLFLQWTAHHNCTMIKSSMAFALIAAAAWCALWARSPARGWRVVLAVALFYTLAENVRAYERGYVFSRDPGRYERLASDMAKHTRDDAVVFANWGRWDLGLPQVMYYLKRNICRVQTRDEAVAWLEEHGRDRGLYFTIGSDLAVESVERLP